MPKKTLEEVIVEPRKYFQVRLMQIMFDIRKMIYDDGEVVSALRSLRGMIDSLPIPHKQKLADIYDRLVYLEHHVSMIKREEVENIYSEVAGYVIEHIFSDVKEIDMGFSHTWIAKLKKTKK